jgi:hypothetical protein
MLTQNRPSSFLAAVEELQEIFFSEPTAPHNAINGFFQLFERLGKCLIVKTELAPTSATSDFNRMLQPSDLFLQLLSAARARDWPQVIVIEHELRP